MTAETREQTLARAFVELADSLVGDFDVTDLLHVLARHVTTVLAADAAGILLTDHRGHLQLLASSEEATRLLELFELQNHEGPCLDCFHRGELVSIPDLAAEADRWPNFVPAALRAGYTGVHALPMRLRADVIGALNLFSVDVGTLPTEDLQAAQALADVATIAILQERAAQHREIVVEQTQSALNSRTVIEQAKGLLSAAGLDMDQAFEVLRLHAHLTGSRLVVIARDLVERRLDPADLRTEVGTGVSQTLPSSEEVSR